MKAKYLYINGEYVHTNQELRHKVQKLIDDKNTSGDATIRLLSDLYRNGHLREFCSQNEYQNGKVDVSDIITFDDNLKGDIKIANHVAARLKRDDSYAPFTFGIHVHFLIHSVSISREAEYESEIRTIRYVPTEKKDTESIFLLNGYRHHKQSKKIARVNITYSIDNKESLEEQIPISIGYHSKILNLSQIGEKEEVSISINEADLDPQKDISVLIGENGCYGKIILKAPQKNVQLELFGHSISYPMMRILVGKSGKSFYMGIWPVEYKNEYTVFDKSVSKIKVIGWREHVSKKAYIVQEYLKHNIEFFLFPTCNVDERSYSWKELKSLINEMFIARMNTPHGEILNIPTKEEWEYASLLYEGNMSMCGDAVTFIGNDQTSLSSATLKKHFQANAYGIYAMFGNVYELAISDGIPYFMGGTIVSKATNLGAITNIPSVPFVGLRLVMRNVD